MDTKLDYSNLNLRNKTFLDFTNNMAIIEQVFGGLSENTISHFKSRSHNEGVKYGTYMEYADVIKDKKFRAAVEKEFADFRNSLIRD